MISKPCSYRSRDKGVPTDGHGFVDADQAILLPVAYIIIPYYPMGSVYNKLTN